METFNDDVIRSIATYILAELDNPGIKEIERLDLSNLQLTCLPRILISKFPKLNELDLSSNHQLKYLPNEIKEMGGIGWVEKGKIQFSLGEDYSVYGPVSFKKDYISVFYQW